MFILAASLLLLGSLAGHSTINTVDAYVEALAANLDADLTHFQPMVAMLCGHGKYHNQYLSANKRWISDPDSKAVCTRDKLRILEYCRKVYPKRDIRNIVESNKHYWVSSWCKAGSSSNRKCKSGKRLVKPFRCLEGVFQSDALLVPEHCLFDHVHNQSVCQSSAYWDRTAATNCARKKMTLQSYAVLQPCGVGIFEGVEYVCCPSSTGKATHMRKATTTTTTTTTSIPQLKSYREEEDDDSDDDNDEDDDDSSSASNSDEDDDDDSDEDDDDDEYYDSDDYEEDEASTTSTTTTTTTTTTERPIDHYLSHFDSSREHDSFKAAQRSLDEDHRDKVTKVMKQWSELEERYQEMKVKDPMAAESFKKKMTSKFQKTVEALEEEGSAERRQLLSMHQQRVMTIINMRKKDAMDCYTKSLDLTPSKTKRIEKCLERLLRALEKDRLHTLHHFRHLLNTNSKTALREKESMLEHLDNLIRMGNQSIAMLERVPSMSNKIRRRMLGFWHNLRGVALDESINKDGERAIMDKYEEEVARKQQEREHQRMLQEERKQQEMEDKRKKELKQQQQQQQLSSSASATSEDEHEEDEDEKEQLASPSLMTPVATSALDEQQPSEEMNLIHDASSPVKLSHSRSQPFYHNEVTYSVKREPYHDGMKWSGSVYITLAFAGVALLTATIVGIVLLRRHTRRSPINQGFVEVDQTASPEERHVANMQINGYENPTYKYFEASQA